MRILRGPLNILRNWDRQDDEISCPHCLAQLQIDSEDAYYLRVTVVHVQKGDNCAIESTLAGTFSFSCANCGKDSLVFGDERVLVPLGLTLGSTYAEEAKY